MKLDELTIGEVKQLLALVNQSPITSSCTTGAWQLGQNYLILVAGTFYTGRLVGVDRYELVLEDASWVADTGRFAEALAKGVVTDVEPCPAGQTLLGRGAMIAAFRWTHDLPRTVK